jgi:BirA family biotin operon repressor/biotin-[acetyl-CoA-carboxylase] ligase
MLSILLREHGSEPRPWRCTAMASVALVEVLEPRIQEVRIKWPNDVLIDGRKVAGVLAESTWDGQHLTVIVGLGLNVSTSAEALAGIDKPATSLLVASGQRFDRGELLRELIGRIDSWLGRPQEELHQAWQSRLWGRGQSVRLADLDSEQDVVILGAGFDGALRVRLADGTERSTTTGELIL